MTLVHVWTLHLNFFNKYCVKTLCFFFHCWEVKYSKCESTALGARNLFWTEPLIRGFSCLADSFIAGKSFCGGYFEDTCLKSFDAASGTPGLSSLLTRSRQKPVTGWRKTQLQDFPFLFSSFLKDFFCKSVFYLRETSKIGYVKANLLYTVKYFSFQLVLTLKVM